jgi:hypothetical protein
MKAPPMKPTPLPSPCTFIPMLPEPQETLLAKEVPYGEIIDDERKPVQFVIFTASANELAF